MFYSNLPFLMKQKSIRGTDLKLKARIASQTLTNARGKNIGRCQLNTLARIAKALGVTPSELFTYTPDDESL